MLNFCSFYRKYQIFVKSWSNWKIDKVAFQFDLRFTAIWIFLKFSNTLIIWFSIYSCLQAAKLKIKNAIYALRSSVHQNGVVCYKNPLCTSVSSSTFLYISFLIWFCCFQAFWELFFLVYAMLNKLSSECMIQRNNWVKP